MKPVPFKHGGTLCFRLIHEFPAVTKLSASELRRLLLDASLYGYVLQTTSCNLQEAAAARYISSEMEDKEALDALLDAVEDATEITQLIAAGLAKHPVHLDDSGAVKLASLAQSCGTTLEALVEHLLKWGPLLLDEGHFGACLVYHSTTTPSRTAAGEDRREGFQLERKGVHHKDLGREGLRAILLEHPDREVAQMIWALYHCSSTLGWSVGSFNNFGIERRAVFNLEITQLPLAFKEDPADLLRYIAETLNAQPSLY